MADATVRNTVLVVPCFNEAGRLEPDRFLRCVDQDEDLGFVFVDDGSTDGTGELLHRMESRRPSAVSVISLAENRGKAEAVRAGVLQALDSGCSRVGYWDADLATPLDELGAFGRVLDQRPATELVLGSRVMLMGRDIRRTALRHYLGRCFATVASVVLGLPVYDTQCGAKLLRASPAVRETFAAPFLSRWIFDVELLARFMQTESVGCPDRAKAIYELPVSQWVDVAGSKVRARHFLMAIADMVRIHFRYRPRRAGPRRSQPPEGDQNFTT